MAGTQISQGIILPAGLGDPQGGEMIVFFHHKNHRRQSDGVRLFIIKLAQLTQTGKREGRRAFPNNPPTHQGHCNWLEAMSISLDTSTKSQVMLPMPRGKLCLQVTGREALSHSTQTRSYVSGHSHHQRLASRLWVAPDF